MGGEKIKKKPILILILLFALICINISCTGAVSAATIKINSSSDYNTTNNSLNEQLQSIINSAKNGDTLEFLGKSYRNLSLIINKSLDIISLVKTAISGNTSSNPVFLVTGSGSRWTNITGFNLQTPNGNGIVVQNTSNIKISNDNVSSTNGTGIKITGSNGINVENSSIFKSQTGISVTNSKNINITNNSLKNNNGDGIGVGNSQNLNVSKNSVSSNGNNGISVDKSQNVTMQNNSIETNGNNGVNLKDTNKIQVDNNNINSNQGNGIYFDENVTNTKLTNNTIFLNKASGLDLDKSGANTTIIHNIITNNEFGININYSTNNLVITENTIVDNSQWDNSGEEINFGPNFINNDTMNVNTNDIYGSEAKIVYVGDSGTYVHFGENWYGSSDPSICPYLITQYMLLELGESNGVWTAAITYTNNSTATGIPSTGVIFKLNGDSEEVSTVNGEASIKFPSSDYKSTGNVITAKAPNLPNVTNNIPDSVVKTIITELNNPSSGGNSGNSGGNSGNSGGNSGNSGGNSGNSSGNSGDSSSTSTGQSSSGQVGVSSSSPSSQETGSLSRDSASSSTLGESASSNSAQSSSNKNSPTTQSVSLTNIENPNLWSIISLVLIIITIMLVYYRNEIVKMSKK